MRSKRLRRSGLILLIDLILPHSAQALGVVGFESSSFLRTSTTRGVNASTLMIGPQFETQNNWIESRVNVRAYTFMTQEPSFTVEAPELFLATSKNILGNHQLTVGRRLYDWSKVDKNWTMMSFWSPRFEWDQIRPQTIGLTGFFYTFETPFWKIKAYGSPISIPDRGTPIRQDEKGQIVSPNPFWRPLPQHMDLLGQQTDIRYQLITPSMQQILMRPAGGFSVQFGPEEGYWVGFNYGYMPVHMVQLATEPTLNLTDVNLNVNIHPRFPMRHLITTEGGLRQRDWSIWTSASTERPSGIQTEKTWMTPLLNPSFIFSSGADFYLNPRLKIATSVLSIQETEKKIDPDAPNFKVDLPSRFPLKTALQLTGAYQFSPKVHSEGRWVRDLQQKADLVSLDVIYQVHRSGLVLGVGADRVSSLTSQGWVGQFVGDDRVRGKVQYGF